MKVVQLDNRKALGWSPTKLLLGLTLGLVLGTAGVTAKPTLRLLEVQGMDRLEAEEALEIGALERQLSALAGPGELVSLAGLTEQLSQVFPSQPAAMELYAELRAASDLTSVQLDQLSLDAAEEELGPAAAGRWIRLTFANLTGQARPDALVAMVELLKLSGRPTLVDRITIQRAEVTDPSFNFQLRLAFPFEGAPPAPEEQ